MSTTNKVTSNREEIEHVICALCRVFSLILAENSYVDGWGCRKSRHHCRKRGPSAPQGPSVVFWQAVSLICWRFLNPFNSTKKEYFTLDFNYQLSLSYALRWSQFQQKWKDPSCLKPDKISHLLASAAIWDHNKACLSMLVCMVFPRGLWNVVDKYQTIVLRSHLFTWCRVSFIFWLPVSDLFRCR